MSTFTLDFVLECDFNESFDAFAPQESAAVPSIGNTLASEGAHGGAIPAGEITLQVFALVRGNFSVHSFGPPSLQFYLIRQRGSPPSLKHSPITLPAPTSGSHPSHDVTFEHLFDVRFQLSLIERDKQTQAAVAAFVDAPADVQRRAQNVGFGGNVRSIFKLQVAAYLDRDVLGYTLAPRRPGF